MITQYTTMAVQDLRDMANPDNPRIMRPEVKQTLGEVLSEFGCVEPIVINQRTNQIVGGHQRVDAALATGIKELPVAIIDVSPDQELAFNIGLNKVRGSWDMSKLADLLAELDGDIALTGFDGDEVEAICNQYNLDIEELTDDDGISQIPANKTAQEAKQEAEALTHIQFGRFNNRVESGVYQQWILDLQAKSTGKSPQEIGAVVAEILGITVSEPEPDEEDLSEYGADPLEDEE